jgi:hypothetical protein
MPTIYSQMHARLMALANSTFQTSYIQPNLKCLDPYQAKSYWKGFRGPLCFNASDFPVVPPPPAPPAPSLDCFQIASPDGQLCLVGKTLGLRPCINGEGPPLPPQWKMGDLETG